MTLDVGRRMLCIKGKNYFRVKEEQEPLNHWEAQPER